MYNFFIYHVFFIIFVILQYLQNISFIMDSLISSFYRFRKLCQDKIV